MGLSFVTNGIVGAETAEAGFLDDKGFYINVCKDGKPTDELNDTDVVCFRCAATDSNGYHSLVEVAKNGYYMPPRATVTLEKVEEPGEWEANGLKVQQRLHTLRVTWK